MHTHFLKFFMLFIAGLVLLYFSETAVLSAISYLIILVSVYFMLTAFILKKRSF